MRTEPFFVVGVQRSGTTVLRLMLNSHPRMAVPFESDFLAVLPLAERIGPLHTAASRRTVLDALAMEPFTRKGEIVTDPDAVLAHPIGSFGDLVSAAFAEWARAKGKPRWGVKTPGYVTELDTLAGHFPTARFIHIVRDGRDVALSHRGLSWGNKSLPRVAKEWKTRVLLGCKMGRILGPARYHELRYEDLIRNPAGELQAICRFLGEEYDPVMLEYHRHARAEMPASSLEWHRRSISQPDESKVFAWRKEMSLADRILFDEYAGDVLARLGYEPVRHRHTLTSRLKQIYYATV